MNIKIDSKNTIFLIDGSSYLYRAYYGMQPLHTLQGQPVQAVFSFCRMLKKLINQVSPEYMVLAWDSKGPTTRQKMYAEYKQERQVPPSDLFTQKDLIIEFADLIGLRQIAEPGIEADDLMYSIAQEGKKHNLRSVFVTSDKDMAQALDQTTFWYDPMKDQLFDEAEFEKKWGFVPARAVLYYALLGDPSDNIPGVRGIGKTGAQELAQQFSTLEDLYKNLEQIKKPRLKKALEEQKENAFLSRDLFLLQYNPSGLTSEQCIFDAQNWERAYSFFEKLNFKSLLPKQPIAPEESAKKLAQYNFIAVTTDAQLQEICIQFKTHNACALDTETMGLDPLADDCIGISVCFQEGTAYYIPFGHMSGEQQLTQKAVVSALKPFLENPAYAKYFHNAKFDLLALHSLGITLHGLKLDTMVAARLVVREWQKLSLKDLSEHYFQESMITYQEAVKNNGYKNFAQVPLEPATRYAAADAHQTCKLAQVLSKQLSADGMEKYYETIEHPLITILTEMEITGIALDQKLLEKLSHQVAQELHTLEQEIIEQSQLGDEKINLNSPRQIERLLFEILKLPPHKKSSKKTGYSTDQEVLSALVELHPVPGLLLKYRELFKLKNTYLDALPTYINPKTGRIHTSFNQVAVATGRLSSSNPNLQNIPTDSGYGIEIRAAFTADPGALLLSADYSQIELRVLAQLSQDPALINAFLQKQDIHAQTAARLFDVNLGTVTSEQRQIGKRINFSILYGLTPYGLSKDLGIPFSTAKIYIEKYFAQYPRVLEWMEAAVVEAQTYGYVTTYWGRRRYIPAINEKNPTLFQEARRIAINTKAQGTAAEIMKIGMINLCRAYQEQQLPAQILLQIHDELLISIPAGQHQEIADITQKTLESVVSWTIPLEVSIRTGKHWKEITK